MGEHSLLSDAESSVAHGNPKSAQLLLHHKKMGEKQSKLHWCVLAEVSCARFVCATFPLPRACAVDKYVVCGSFQFHAQDWNGCRRRLQKHNGAEARSANSSESNFLKAAQSASNSMSHEILNRCLFIPFFPIQMTINPSIKDGDLPLHFACYNGLAPPDIIRALLDAYPESVRKENRLGRYPLELAAINYQIDDPYRDEVLFVLRWYLPPSRNTALLPGIFSLKPPNQMYSASAQCVVCMELPSTVAMIPCGHVCLCMNCVSTAASCGSCPVDRCHIQGLYQLHGEQTNIHESMLRVEASWMIFFLKKIFYTETMAFFSWYIFQCLTLGLFLLYILNKDNF